MNFNTSSCCNMIYIIIPQNVSILLEEKKGCKKICQNIARNC